MNHVSTAKAKSYANIYHAEKDDEVERLVAAAESWLAKFLGFGSLADDELRRDPGASPPPDSDGADLLKPDVELCVLMIFDDFWQNHGTQVVGTITSENPSFMRVAHLYRKDLGV